MPCETFYPSVSFGARRHQPNKKCVIAKLTLSNNTPYTKPGARVTLQFIKLIIHCAKAKYISVI